jgi:hypothetical protein
LFDPQIGTIVVRGTSYPSFLCYCSSFALEMTSMMNNLNQDIMTDIENNIAGGSPAAGRHHHYPKQ